MKAVVMAGGRGTRLRPLTEGRPKPLVPVANRPVVEHILRLLQENGFDEVFVTAHYLPEQLEAWLAAERELGLDVHLVRETQPLGTAGSVKQLEQSLDGTFLVISGDCLTDFRLRDAVTWHIEKGAEATIVVTEVPDPLPFGIVDATEEGRIVRFLEKPARHEVFSNTVNAGVYVLEPSVLGRCPNGAFFDFSRNLFPAMLSGGSPLYAYRGVGYWSDIGDCQQYIRSQIDALYGRVRLSALASGDGRRLWIDPAATIEAGATVIPPVIVGPGAFVSQGARVGPAVALGPHSRIERGAVIERSVVMEGAVVARGATVLGAAIGRRAVVGEGAALFEGAAIGDESRVQADGLVAADAKGR